MTHENHQVNQDAKNLWVETYISSRAETSTNRAADADEAVAAFNERFQVQPEERVVMPDDLASAQLAITIHQAPEGDDKKITVWANGRRVGLLQSIDIRADLTTVGAAIKMIDLPPPDAEAEGFDEDTYANLRKSYEETRDMLDSAVPWASVVATR